MTKIKSKISNPIAIGLNLSGSVVKSKAISEKYLQGRRESKIIDIYQQPALAIREDIVAIPDLINKFPIPEERVTGYLPDTEQVLKGLHFLHN